MSIGSVLHSIAVGSRWPATLLQFLFGISSCLPENIGIACHNGRRPLSHYYLFTIPAVLITY